MTKKKTYYTIFASFFAMLVMAITENSRGVLVPTYKEEFGVSNTGIGFFLALVTLSFIVSTHFAGRLVKNYGQKKSAMIGMSIAGSGFLITAFTQYFWQFLITYVLLTVGISFLIMGLNTIVPLLKVAYLSVVMNSLHFFYGVGGTLTQRLTGYLIVNNISWRMIFIGFSGLFALGVLFYAFVEQPERKIEHKHLSRVKIYEKPLVWMFGLGLGFYVTAEIQTANWFVNYMNEVYGYTENQASFYSATFFLTLSVGRLFGGYILEKIGYLKGIIGSISLALFLYVIGLVGESTLILISISGVFFAIVYPTTILLLQNFFEHNISRVVAMVTMTASGVSMVFGYVIGALSDLIGVRISYYIMPLSLGVALILMVKISRYMKVVEEKRKEEVV